MTYEEAIQIITKRKHDADQDKIVALMDSDSQALDMAIKALTYLQQHEDEKA